MKKKLKEIRERIAKQRSIAGGEILMTDFQIVPVDSACNQLLLSTDALTTALDALEKYGDEENYDVSPNVHRWQGKKMKWMFRDAQTAINKIHKELRLSDDN